MFIFENISNKNFHDIPLRNFDGNLRTVKVHKNPSLTFSEKSPSKWSFWKNNFEKKITEKSQFWSKNVRFRWIMHNFERKCDISFENEALIFGLKNFGTIWTKFELGFWDIIWILIIWTLTSMSIISLTVDSKTKNRNYPRSQLENFLSVFFPRKFAEYFILESNEMQTGQFRVDFES